MQSLSSGSSKSSLNRGETPESHQIPVTSAQSSTVTSNGGKAAQQKASLLRPPTQIRRSALPRPTTTLTKR